MTPITWLIFIAAAILEVAGDATIRKGLMVSSYFFIVCGFLILGSYGMVVNLVKWDFSKMLGVYVAIFAVISVLWGKFLFKESIPMSTWIGLAVIVTGGLIIQSGTR